MCIRDSPTVVSSYSEFQSKFGDSFLSGSNYYTYLTSIAAQQYLRHSNKLTVVRILDGTYSGANAEVPAALGVGAVATGSIALHADFMTDEGDELRIVKGGTTFRFQAADPTAVPDDNASGNLYFHATGSDGTTAVNFLTGSVNGASIGFTAVSSSNGLEITASTGLGNNGVLIQTGSGGTFSTVATLGGAGTGASSTTSFKLNTQAHGAVMNNIAAHSLSLIHI